MGIAIGIVIGLVVGSIIGMLFMSMLNTRVTNHDIALMAQMEPLISAESYDFKEFVGAISKLTDRAQATFIYLYIQAIRGNKRLLSTMNRYLAAVDRIQLKVVVKEKALTRPARTTKS